MEYILQNTDIFDEEITEKFRKIIVSNIESLITDNPYIFKVSFHVNLLNDIRFEEFNIPVPSKTNKGTKEDKIYDVMSYQLKRLEQILNENTIEVYSTTIQGDNLENENIIKIELYEEFSKPVITGRGKNKKRMKVSSVIPSLPFSQKNISQLASERLSKIFYDFMNIIKDKKIISEILEIEETDDDEILFRAFDKQYGDLWLATKEREKELMDRLIKRSLTVIEKYLEKEDKVK